MSCEESFTVSLLRGIRDPAARQIVGKDAKAQSTQSSGGFSPRYVRGDGDSVYENDEFAARRPKEPIACSTVGSGHILWLWEHHAFNIGPTFGGSQSGQSSRRKGQHFCLRLDQNNL